MKNYLDKQEKYNKDFSDAMVKEFRRMKYGIASCYPKKNLDLATMRKELVDWQSNADYTPLSAIRSNYKKWLPINFCDEQELCYVNINVNNPEAVSKSYRVNPSQLIWTFTHNLGFFPNVTTTDDFNQEIVGTVTYIDVNSLKVEFSNPVSGWAYLS